MKKQISKLLGIIVLSLVLNSCGVQWQYTTESYDEIYGVEVEEINTVSQLNWKFRNDFRFSNDYYYFFATQPYSFFHYNFYYNGLYNWGWSNPLDYYLNWQWGWNSGYPYWRPYNQYPWYGHWNTNYWWNWQNRPYNYSYVYGPRTSYLGNVYVRRGFNNRTLSNTTHSTNNIQNQIQISREKPRVTQQHIKPIIINPNDKPNPPIRVRPPVNNNKPNNWNNSKPNNPRPPVYNNNRPSNNSRPVISKPSRPITPPRSNSKRGGQ